MASYSVILKPTAKRQIEAIDHRADRQRIVQCILRLADNPRPHGCDKLAGTKNTYRVRQGDYRILYSIEDEILIVSIVHVAHRKDVYRRRGRA